MAFGKDRRQLYAGNDRQRARRSTKTPKRSGGGGFYGDMYKPPTHGNPDIIRLHAGDFKVPLVDEDKGELIIDDVGQIVQVSQSYLKYVEHYHGGKKRSSTCSAGPLGEFKGKGEPCLACDWFWWEWRQRQANKSDHPKAMSRRTMWGFSVLVLAPHHKVEQTDNEGNVRMNDKTNQPYYNWEKCTGRGCQNCAAGKETKQGHRQPWSMGKTHFNTLFDYTSVLGKHCRVCSQQDCIEDLAWICSNPECGEAVIDLGTSQLTDEQVETMTLDPVTCPTCRVEGFLRDVYSCRNCSTTGREGERATLFDFDLYVKRVEDPSPDTKATSLQIIRAVGPKPIDSMYGDEMRKALDLTRIFAPTALERQLSMFGKPPSSGAEPQRTPVNAGVSQ